MTHNKLTCLFGHHDYDKEYTMDNYGRLVRLCKVCRRSGYRKWDNGDESWYDYNENGTRTHERWNDGKEYWKANNGRWAEKKPKNWKYENGAI